MMLMTAQQKDRRQRNHRPPQLQLGPVMVQSLAGAMALGSAPLRKGRCQKNHPL
jgi:hypothetical protein